MSNTFKPGDWAYYVSPFYGRIAFGKIIFIRETKRLNYQDLRQYAMDVPLIGDPELVSDVFATKQELLDFLMLNIVNDAKS